MINPSGTIELLWNMHIIDTAIRYICYYLIGLIIFSELCSFVRDSFLMTLSRAIFVFGCYFVLTSVDDIYSHLFATAVLTLLLGVAMCWTLYAIRAVQFGLKKTGKTIRQSLLECNITATASQSRLRINNRTQNRTLQ